MTDISSNKTHRAAGRAFRRLIIMVMCLLCLGLLASALFTFSTLMRSRADFLSHRGHEIVSAVEAQARGPSRRNNPAFWQSVIESNLETYSRSVASISLLDQNGNVLAGKAKTSTESLESGISAGADVFIFEEKLPPPRNPHGERYPSTANWRLRVGLYSEDADFIRRTAFLQLSVSALAIATLIPLSIFLMRMIDRFVELKAREGAEAQLRSLGIMAASLAHEIRNPLGAMKGLTQLAQEELAAGHPAQAQLRTVVGEAERLEKLVADLLDFARAREPQISEFNLMDVLSDIKNILQSRLDASRAALQLSVEPNPFNIRSDPAGLRQVLLNILINAIDASPAGSTVVLTAGREEAHKSVVIRVDDSGAGLDPKSPGELFQPFVTTKVRGTGLGLAISKQIIESLGGKLTLENLPQGGARCSVILPTS